MDGLYRWDMAVFRLVNVGWHRVWLDPFFLVVSTSGLGGLQALAVLGLYRWPALRRFIVPCVVAIAVTGLLFADVIKELDLVVRDRPSFLLYALPQERVRHSSFPSGHTTTSFALATMLLLMTLGTRQARWGWVALVWAFLVGLSRVYRGVHWPTDALAGACVGAFGSGLVYLVFARKGWLDLRLERRPRGA